MEQTKSTKAPARDTERGHKPNFIVGLRGPNEVNESERVCLECQITPVGDPNMTFTWFKNGKELRPSSRIATSNDFGYVFLEIAAAEENDSGIYTVKIANNYGEAKSSHNLKVKTFPKIYSGTQHPEAYRHIRELEMGKSGNLMARDSPNLIDNSPRFVSHLNSNNCVEEGGYLRLTAKVEPCNDENLVIEWYKNGKYLIVGSRTTTYFDFGLVVLEITNTKVEDSGIYVCRYICSYI